MVKLLICFGTFLLLILDTLNYGITLSKYMLSVELILDNWWRCSYLVSDTPWIGLYPVERICIFRLWRRTTLAALDMSQCPTFVWQVSEISNRCPKIIYLFILCSDAPWISVWHPYDTHTTRVGQPETSVPKKHYF